MYFLQFFRVCPSKLSTYDYRCCAIHKHAHQRGTYPFPSVFPIIHNYLKNTPRTDAMKQVEFKFLEVNVSEIQKKLLRLGCQKIFEGELCDTFMDLPDKSLSARKQTLRVRDLGETVELTVKNKIFKGEGKVTNDVDIHTTDNQNALAFLKQLEYHITKTQCKHRISYILMGQGRKMSFELDTPPTIPTWLEIEGPSITLVKRYIQLLELDVTEAKTWTSKEVIAYYRRKKDLLLASYPFSWIRLF